MDPEHLRASAERDHLWASLRTLLPDIQRLAGGGFDGSERDQQLLLLLARIVAAELAFRAEDAEQTLPPDAG
jgi:hypothetical protein